MTEYATGYQPITSYGDNDLHGDDHHGDCDAEAPPSENIVHVVPDKSRGKYSYAGCYVFIRRMLCFLTVLAMIHNRYLTPYIYTGCSISCPFLKKIVLRSCTFKIKEYITESLVSIYMQAVNSLTRSCYLQNQILLSTCIDDIFPICLY